MERNIGLTGYYFRVIIGEVTLNTVDELPFKASSLILFPDVVAAASAVKVYEYCCFICGFCFFSDPTLYT